MQDLPENHIGLQDKKRITFDLAIATSPLATAEQLELQAMSDNPEIVWHVAAHPHTSAETLGMLAFDPEPEVRATVAENPNAPAFVVAALSKDLHPEVRAVACARIDAALDSAHTRRSAVAANDAFDGETDGDAHTRVAERRVGPLTLRLAFERKT